MSEISAPPDLTQAAGFLPLTLPPIDFDSAYQQRQQQQSASVEPVTTTETPWENVTVQ